MRSGYIHLDYEALRYAGIGAYGRSQLAQSEIAGAYNLDIYNQNITSSHHGTRYDAFPVPVIKKHPMALI